MRAGGNHSEILFWEDEFVGVNLGWDFCSEHEWGIKSLYANFGIDNKLRKDNLGFINRKITRCPKDLHLLENKDETILVYQSSYSSSKLDFERFKTQILRENYGWEERGIACGWSERDFGILATGKENRKYLRSLYSSFKDNNIVIFLSGDANPFSNSGLKIVMFDKIPEDALKMAIEADEDSLSLQEASDKTEIIQRLDEVQKNSNSIYLKKCGYFACSPRWANDKEKEDTKYPVVYWLNPQDQKNNSAGWFTVEELEKWIEGKGPIIKEK